MAHENMVCMLFYHASFAPICFYAILSTVTLFHFYLNMYMVYFSICGNLSVLLQKSVSTLWISLAPTRCFFSASGLCLSLPNISCVGLRQVKQRNELSHLAFLMRSIASLLLKNKHVYALLLCRVCVCVCLCTR